jgi:hypothetical protein
MPTSVSDARSNANDQIVHAASRIRGANLRAVFDAIYRGKTQVKSVAELAAMTGLTEKQVLSAGKVLAANHIVEQTKKDGRVAYRKDTFYAANKTKILALGKDPKKLAAVPTKTSPRVRVEMT